MGIATDDLELFFELLGDRCLLRALRIKRATRTNGVGLARVRQM